MMFPGSRLAAGTIRVSGAVGGGGGGSKVGETYLLSPGVPGALRYLTAPWVD